jgi:ribosomal protein S18 acetylase RimI-like enzyme
VTGRPRALGFGTDLVLLRQQGSTVQERDGYLAVRTPANPTYHWGNFLLLDQAPAPGSLGAWLAVFREEHPGAKHVAIGIDDPDGEPDPAEAEARGLAVERDVVLTTTTLEPGPWPGDVDLRTLDPASDAAWAALADLEMASFETADPAAHRVFVERRLAGHRASVRAGHGAWCAAYRPDGTPVSTLGIFAAGDGVARFQDVATLAAYRRRGLAGALVRYAGALARDRLGVRGLVIVADPAGPAIGVYRRAGFTDHSAQWALYRPEAATRVPGPS